MSELKKIPGALKTIFTTKKQEPVGIINQLAELSEKARKDGLLSLEQDAQNNENELIKKGLALVVDGIETEVIKDILMRETELHESMYESTAKIFEACGGYGPTMGVLGTVMGMVNVLSTMDAEPGGLGEKIASAFLATMFGVGSANLLWIPFAGRIKAKGQSEKMISDLIIEGLGHGCIGLVAAHRRGALVLIIDVRRGTERLLQAPGADERGRPPQLIDLAHLFRDLDKALFAHFLQDQIHREEHRQEIGCHRLHGLRVQHRRRGHR
jgi:hypothetical protein